jgi:alkanesulfonate monooxygenase SsuD/methylene tetrahydromethanopterin reductase-like flavin-dependent oxidoreductase (luciferase family)
MKLGILVETEEGLNWEHWRSVVADAERLGFHSVWISDHFLSPWVADRHGIDPWLALAVAAAETRRVLLGTLVSPITFREPAIMARMAESVDDLSEGRFVLGLGLGWNAGEHHAAGIAFPSVTERRRRLKHGIELIRRILGERRVPLLIGGGGPGSTLPLVARYADHWNMTTNSAAAFSARSTLLADLCNEIGRDPRQITRSVAVGYLAGRDAADLDGRAERMRQIVPPLANVPNVVEGTREMGWVTGTPGELITQLKTIGEAGVDVAILGHYDVSDAAALDLVAHEVMPNLA